MSPFLGELLGTMTLIIFGDGVVAGVLLKDSKAEGAGWLAITTAWGLAVLCGIFVATATGSPEAHINPAVTVANAIETQSTAATVYVTHPSTILIAHTRARFHCR